MPDAEDYANVDVDVDASTNANANANANMPQKPTQNWTPPHTPAQPNPTKNLSEPQDISENLMAQPPIPIIADNLDLPPMHATRHSRDRRHSTPRSNNNHVIGLVCGVDAVCAGFA